MDNPQTRRIRDWMSEHPIKISSSTTLPEAYWLMVENSIRRLLVVDNDHLVGIVTMEDLRGSFHSEIIAINPLRVNEILSEMPIRQLMSKDPITISPDVNVIEAAETMLKHKISTLPVASEGKVVGVITESDLFRVLVDMCRGQEVQGDRKAEIGISKADE